MAKGLETITFSMKSGDVSNVIDTKQGYVMLILEGIQVHQPEIFTAAPRRDCCGNLPFKICRSGSL
jgi:hypothetical protein